VHWFVLLLVAIVWNALIMWLTPHRYHDLLNSLVGDAWAFYLCLWMRRLDENSRSAFWCDAFVIIEMAAASISIAQHPSVHLQLIGDILTTISTILGLVTIYMVRSDLLRHYNEREPIGLHLGPWMTFFFSFLYFQSQLYEIAQFRKRQAKGLVTDSSQTLH